MVSHSQEKPVSLGLGRGNFVCFDHDYIRKQGLFILNIKICKVYMSDCADKTPDYVNNFSFFQRIDSYNLENITNGPKASISKHYDDKDTSEP